MVVLRAEREEGWLILSAVHPSPPLHSPPVPGTAWLALQGRRRVNTLCRRRASSCVRGRRCEKAEFWGFTF